MLQQSPWAHTLIVRLPTSAVPYERILRTNPYCYALSVDPSSPQLLIRRLTLPHPPSPITSSPDLLFASKSCALIPGSLGTRYSTLQSL